MKQNRVVAFTVPLGFIVRNILRSDIFKTLKAEGYRIILLSTKPKDTDFVAEFQDENVIIEHLIPFEIPFLPAKLSGLKQRIFFNVNEVDSIKIARQAMKQNNPRQYYSEKIKDGLAGKSRRVMKILEWFEIKLIKSRYYRDLLQKYHVDAVFLSCAGLFDIEKPLFCEARRLGIRTLGMISNWDHIPDRGKIYRFDSIVAWNEIQKNYLTAMYGYQPADVFLSGIPQFDIYSLKDKLMRREEFCRKIGADPQKKIITCMTTTPTSFPNEFEIVDIIARSIEKNRLDMPAQVLVRLHPRGEEALFEDVKKHKSVIFERPGRPSVFFDKWNPTEDDMYHFMNILAHSDVIVNRSSTTTLDAAVFGTPAVCIGFDGYQKKDYFSSMRRFYDYNPYIHIAGSGGIRVAYSEQELIAHLNTYLKDRSQDSAGREKILAENCYKLDGCSGKRIAEFIMSNINGEKPQEL